MSARLTVSLLGSPCIACDTKPIAIDRRKVVALTAYLAVTGATHTRDSLATLLWPGLDQSNARAALRRTLYHTKKALGDEWLDISRETLALKRNAGLWVDVDQFHAHLAKCQTHSHPIDASCPACLDSLSRAVALYRDDFLTGFTLFDAPEFDDWQLFQAESLRREIIDALKRLVRGLSVRKDFDPAIRHAQRWLALDPLNESAHYDMMQLYARAGQRTAALRQYDRCVQILQQTLGIPPQEKVTQLRETIKRKQLPHPTDLTLYPAFQSHNLPPQPTLCIGRELELAKIDQLLRDPACRLLTLVGPGGVGKTRLGLEAALRAAAIGNELFPDGVYFVSLAELDSADSLVLAVVNALCLSFHGPASPEAQLFNYLREKEMLLMLDNYEHLLEGTELVQKILGTAPGVKLLLTSRERLNLKWEWLLDVKGLRFPKNRDDDTQRLEQEYSAVQLFVQRARMVCSNFYLSEAERPFVVRICQLLEGLPLGIELTAAWVGMLSCQKIAEELAYDLNLDLLANSLRDVPERHRSMRAAFDHSWNLLSEEEQKVLQRLSVFHGGFSKEAACWVCNASLPLLLTLMHKSLVHRGTADRYILLQVLRQYTEEKLQESNESEQVNDRHCEYYADFLHKQGRHLKKKGEKSALERIEQEIGNICAAWQWATTHEKITVIDKSIESLYCFYDARSWFGEGQEVFGKTIAALVGEQWPLETVLREDRRRVVGKLLTRQGVLCKMLTDWEKANELLQISLAISRDLGVHKDVVLCLLHLGCVAEDVGEMAKARRLYIEGLALARKIEDQLGIAGCLSGLGRLAENLGKYAQTRRFHQKALIIFQRLDDKRGIARCCNNLGIHARKIEDYDEAKRLFGESLAIKRKLGDKRGMSITLNNLGIVAERCEEYSLAQQLYRESLNLKQELGDRLGAARSLGCLGIVAEHMEEYDEAKRLHQESVAISTEIGDQRVLANCLNNLGFTLLMLGDSQAARGSFLHALEKAMEMQVVPIVLESLLGMAAILMKDGKEESAVELVTYVLYHSAVIHEVRNRAEDLISELKTRLSPLAFESAQARGKTREIEYLVHVCKIDQLEAAKIDSAIVMAE